MNTMMNNDSTPEEPLKKRRRKEIKNDTLQDPTKKNPIGDKKNRRKHNPKFRLKITGYAASLSTADNERVPLVLTDIQHLLLHSLLGNLNITQSPRWYVIDKCNHVSQTTCLIIEGISINHWEQYKDKLLNINKIFDDFVETLTPSVYNGSFVTELALVPLSETEKEAIIQKYGSMNLALEIRKDVMVMMQAVFPINDSFKVKAQVMSVDVF